MTRDLEFGEAMHVYTLDALPVPSVSGILRGAGLIDFTQIPIVELQAAQARGTIVHRAIHYYNENDLDVGQFWDEFPDYVGYLEAWIAFRRQRCFEPILNERRVASRRHRVAGTLDCLGMLDGVGALVDFKTGHPGDVAADLQTAAYLLLALEWSVDDPALHAYFARHAVVRRYAVQLHADATFTVEGYTAPGDSREFLTLVDARRIVEKRRGVQVAA